MDTPSSPSNLPRQADMENADDLSPHPRRTSRALTFIAFAAVAAVLALARDFIVPLALAGLLAFTLEPLAHGLEKMRLPRGLAAVLSVLVLGSGLGVLVYAVAGQAVDLAHHLPDYRENLTRKLASLRDSSLASPIVEAKENLRKLGDEMTREKQEPKDAKGDPIPPAPKVPALPEPVAKVQVVEPGGGHPLKDLLGAVGPVLAPLGLLFVVLMLTAFVLTYRDDLRERTMRLASLGDLALTTQAFDEAAKRVSRYLRAMVVINAFYAALLSIAFAAVGLPNALLWGILAGALRFMPYIGTWVGAAFPVLLSIAVFDGWSRTLLTFCSVLGIDLVIGNIVEPIVYGKRSGVSPWAVVVATLLWTWLWGIPGLLLAVPITLVMAVAGRYVPSLRFLDVLLGDGPILARHERVYQRLLALDEEGARAVVEEHAKESGILSSFDDVLVPALSQAGSDHARGRIDGAALAAVRDGAKSVLSHLTTAAEDALPKKDRKDKEADPAAALPAQVLCIPAGDASDGLAAEMLCTALRALDIRAEAASHRLLTAEMGERVTSSAPAVTCIVGVPPFGLARARYACRRIRAEDAATRIVVVPLGAEADSQVLLHRMTEAGAARVAVRLSEAAGVARDLVHQVAETPSPAPQASAPQAAAPPEAAAHAAAG
jgi:predicted PurR-regulated permease PerM